MREDLVQSAVVFLKDGTVRTAPLAKKIEFLESKSLQPDEIQEALTRSNVASEPNHSALFQQQQQQWPQQMPQLPPPLPQRDWRDWFIMAVITSGFSYAIWSLAKVKYMVHDLDTGNCQTSSLDTHHR